MKVQEVIRKVMISIHALRAERDAVVDEPAVGAFFISIHALRAERDFVFLVFVVSVHISIHALRAERDMAKMVMN